MVVAGEREGGGAPAPGGGPRAPGGGGGPPRGGAGGGRAAGQPLPATAGSAIAEDAAVRTRRAGSPTSCADRHRPPPALPRPHPRTRRRRRGIDRPPPPPSAPPPRR